VFVCLARLIRAPASPSAPFLPRGRAPLSRGAFFVGPVSAERHRAKADEALSWLVRLCCRARTPHACHSRRHRRRAGVRLALLGPQGHPLSPRSPILFARRTAIYDRRSPYYAKRPSCTTPKDSSVKGAGSLVARKHWCLIAISAELSAWSKTRGESRGLNLSAICARARRAR
jgi:hypothetical protein